MLEGRIELDLVDRQIVGILQVDGRRPFTRIARELGVSESQVRQRVARLEAAGVMQVVAVTNPIALGLKMTAMIGLRIEPSERERVAAQLAALPEVSYLVVTAGSLDVLCEVVCADHDHLHTFLTRTLAGLDGIRATETLVYLRILKESYGWSAVTSPPTSSPASPSAHGEAPREGQDQGQDQGQGEDNARG
jgi:Lrp/AsnC family transcriptional regulator for asnA, asnC and gidA